MTAVTPGLDLSPLSGLFDIINKIQSQYPQAMSLLSQPGVMQVYADAITNNWSPERLQAALQQTDWWKNTDAPTRQYQALSATDPSTAHQKLTDTQTQLNDLQDQLGIHLSQAGGLASPYAQLLNRAVSEGWDANRLKYEIIAEQVQPGASTTSGGQMGANAAAVKSLANDYGVPLADLQVVQYAMKLGQGTMTGDDMKGYLIEQAKSLFPSLSDALDKGISVKDYVAPYLQIAQQEVGINPADVNLTDSKWMNLLNQVDPKTGARVSMNLDQALKTIRSDPTWGYDTTHKANQDASQLASQLEQKFGAA